MVWPWQAHFDNCGGGRPTCMVAQALVELGRPAHPGGQTSRRAGASLLESHNQCLSLIYD